MVHVNTKQPARPAVRKAVTATWLFASALALSAVAVAQPGMGGRPPAHAGFDNGTLFAGPSHHVVRLVNHLLDGLNVTPAQRSQIVQLAETAANEMKPQRDAERSLREKAMQVLTAPTIDAATAEQLRQQELVLHEQISRRTLAAMIDIGRVLTPQQRATLAERARLHVDAMRERAARQPHDMPRP